MVEGATVTELALSVFVEVSARHGLVVRVNCSKGGLAEVCWKRLNKDLLVLGEFDLRRWIDGVPLGHGQTGSIA